MESVQNFFKRVYDRIDAYVKANPRRATIIAVVVVLLILSFVIRAPQPHVALSGEPLAVGGWFTNTLLTTLIVDMIVLALAFFATRNMTLVPTGLQNVMEAPLTVLRRDRAEVEASARKYLAKVGIAEKCDAYPAQLSGGQQQRAAIARALANDPPLLMGDEPTGNLDSHTADKVFTLFQGLVAQGKTFIMVTHDVELARRMPRLIEVADGVLHEATGQPA